MCSFILKQEFVTELPTSPVLRKYYMRHKNVLFQRLRYGSGLLVQNYYQCLICKCNKRDGSNRWSLHPPLFFQKAGNNTFEVILWIRKADYDIF
jgi:hypothetical protein